MTSNQDYSATFSVSQTPEEAFKAINNVRGWWEGQIEGKTEKIGDVFTYQYGSFHRSEQKVIELVPDKRVVWLVVEGGPKFTESKIEWKGTKIIFNISKKGSKTEVRFTHQGLIPRLECYDSCIDAWGPLIRSNLRKLITRGEVGC
ncbi:MAG: SRPBCC domain-containing protein [Thaumarchaeota archaeon]|nr:SRPBCC domain-containing protein [Nitrososphaerota archaeon]